MAFTHLHLHSEYSLLDGANKITNLAKKIKQLGMNSVSITDHGNMYGAIDFYKTMRSNGIKPIIGMEAYIHNHEELENKDSKLRFHLCLYAKNQEGYENLMYLSSQGFLRGFYFYPRINKMLLKKHSAGLICSSACLQGEINWHLNNKNDRNKRYGAKGYQAALDAALEYKEIFGDDFYIEIMRHGIGDQLNIDKDILRISKETGIKLIATNDTHYTQKTDSAIQEVAMCIAMGKTLNDKARLRHSVHEFYIKSEEEMKMLFSDIPEAIENTQEIANKCNLELKLDDPTPPDFPFVDEYAQKEGLGQVSDKEYFVYKCNEGLDTRLKLVPQERHIEYKKRLEKEIEIISSMNFVGYMLIVWDFINFARTNDIPVGPGRGSAAGSLIAYCLGITNIDPLKYNLLFERFLNPERVSMPDIDTDFCQRKRGEILKYVIDRYGEYNVSQVITFNSMKAKGAIRDVGRVLDYPLQKVDEICKLIPKTPLDITLQGYEKNGEFKQGAFEIEPKIKELIETDKDAKEVWDLALGVEGLKRNSSIHAAAVVIDSKQELWKKTPLCMMERNGDIVTQYDGRFLESVDLVKFDFLGLKTLTVIDDAIKLIKQRYGVDIDFLSLGTDDKKVYETLQSGTTLGIFQLESSGMQDLCRRLKPENFEDLIAILALYRPGPMESGMMDDFIDRKHGIKQNSYPFKELEEILAPTYGVIVYQEQVMQIVQVIGGFSLGGADLVRRAMGKKKKEELDKLKSQFLKGAQERDFDTQKADDLWELIIKFAGYGFNKSHSAAYAFIAYQTAYLKTYYEHEFMAAMLTSESNKIESIAKYIDEVKEMGIEFMPPHINYSSLDFGVGDFKDKDGKDVKKIVFGFSAIKGISTYAINNIIKTREEKGEFKKIEDFIERVDFSVMTKKSVEPLIKSGSLDHLGYSRKNMLDNIDNICNEGRRIAEAKKEMSTGLFLGNDDEKEEKANLDFISTSDNSEDSSTTLAKNEYECIGMYVSGHPLDAYKEKLQNYKCIAKIKDIDDLEVGSTAIIGGKILDFSRKISKSGNAYGNASIIDYSGKLQFAAFGNRFTKLEELFQTNEDQPIFLKCKIEIDNKSDTEQHEIQVLEILSLEELDEVNLKLKFKKDKGRTEGRKSIATRAKNIVLAIPKEKIKNFNIGEFKRQASDYKGENKFTIKIIDDKLEFIFDTEFGVDSKIKTLPIQDGCYFVEQ